MATRMYRARVVEMSPRLEAALKRTHYVFVECLRQMVERYLQMRKGRFGEECRQLANILLEQRDDFAHGLMEMLTCPRVTSNLQTDCIELVRRRHERDGPLFLRHDGFAVVDGVTIHTKPQGKPHPTIGRLAVVTKFWRQVCAGASAYLKSSNELMIRWRRERQEWLRERTVWQEEHPEFMRFWHGPYADFERTCETMRIQSQRDAGQEPTVKKAESRQRGKRVKRWHLWYEWIVAHPQIIEWRGRAKSSDFNAVPAETISRIQRRYPRQDKHIAKLLEWLEENNPELKTLDSLRRTYIRRFLRFRRPPTLTLPSPDKHPYWFTMERDQFYKNVDFEQGTIELLLIDEQNDGAWFLQWFPARIRCDPRLKPSIRAGLFRKEGRYPPYAPGKASSRLNNLKRPALTCEDRRAGYAGAKLVLHKSRTELMFTVIEQDAPRRIRWKKTKQRSCPADNAFSSDGERIRLRVMAIDLGIRHAGAYVVAEGRPVDGRWELRPISKGFVRDGNIPLLHRIRGHDWALKKGRRRRGKPIDGERSFVDLQDHRTSMAQDRFKKVSATIVEIARKQEVDLVLFESLSTLCFTAFDERWMNRQLRDMNRRKVVEMVVDECREFGIECEDTVDPRWTSHVCSRCLKPGWRFSIQKKEPYREKLTRGLCRQFGYPVWDQGGHLFRCPHCGYSVNADVNAAANVAGKFFGRWPSGLTRKDWVYTWTEDSSARVFSAKDSFEEWADAVRTRNMFGDAPF